MNRYCLLLLLLVVVGCDSIAGNGRYQYFDCGDRKEEARFTYEMVRLICMLDTRTGILYKRTDIGLCLKPNMTKPPQGYGKEAYEPYTECWQKYVRLPVPEQKI